MKKGATGTSGAVESHESAKVHGDKLNAFRPGAQSVRFPDAPAGLGDQGCRGGAAGPANVNCGWVRRWGADRGAGRGSLWISTTETAIWARIEARERVNGAQNWRLGA